VDLHEEAVFSDWAGVARKADSDKASMVEKANKRRENTPVPILAISSPPLEWFGCSQEFDAIGRKKDAWALNCATGSRAPRQ
jgi:hypothetical protein